MRPYFFLAAGIAALFAAPVMAQSTDNEKIIGVGARVRTAYDGADSNRGDAIPYLRLYGEHLFARSTQGMLEGGWRTRALGAWVVGTQAAYESGRVTNESAFLEARHFENLDPGASIGLHAEGDWKIGPMPVSALLRYRRHIDSDRGAQADLRVTAGIFARWGVQAGVFGQLTWGDAKSMQSYFGLTPRQSTITGLPEYAAGAGARDLQFGLLGSVELSPHWLIPWGAGIQRLSGDAADSPIAIERTNASVNAGIAYRF